MIYPVQDLTNGQKVESVKYEGKLLSQVHVNQLIQRQRPAVQKTLQFGAAAAPQEFCLFFCFNAFRDGFYSRLFREKSITSSSRYHTRNRSGGAPLMSSLLPWAWIRWYCNCIQFFAASWYTASGIGDFLNVF